MNYSICQSHFSLIWLPQYPAAMVTWHSLVRRVWFLITTHSWYLAVKNSWKAPHGLPRRVRDGVVVFFSSQSYFSFMLVIMIPYLVLLDCNVSGVIKLLLETITFLLLLSSLPLQLLPRLLHPHPHPHPPLHQPQLPTQEYLLSAPQQRRVNGWVDGRNLTHERRTCHYRRNMHFSRTSEHAPAIDSP